MNFNSAIFTKECKSRIRVVIRDTHGSVMASLSKVLPQLHSPLEIEAKVASSALQLAKELGFNQIVLEGDSKVLMHALADNSPFLSTVGSLIDDIRFNAVFFTKLHYSHVFFFFKNYFFKRNITLMLRGKVI